MPTPKFSPGSWKFSQEPICLRFVQFAEHQASPIPVGGDQILNQFGRDLPDNDLRGQEPAYETNRATENRGERHREKGMPTEAQCQNREECHQGEPEIWTFPDRAHEVSDGSNDLEVTRKGPSDLYGRASIARQRRALPGRAGGCPPAPPQTRTSPIKAYGSSSHGFAA